MIREATQEDAGSIADIYNHYINHSVATFEEDEITIEEMQARMTKVRDSGYTWLVALEKKTIVGYAYSSRWNDRAAYRNTAEVSVYLSHACRSKGWGTRLYQRLFETLRDKSIHVVVGGITLPNPASVAIHEKFGMEKVAHFREVGYKFGEWLDVGYWQARLEE